MDDDLPEDTVRACMILWAVDIAAAVLISRCQDSTRRRKIEHHEHPPVTYFLPKSKRWTYGEVLKAGGGKRGECGCYGSNGVFQFKELSLKDSIVYYASRTRKTSELPIGISLILRQNR